ncbi:hypothetical protein HOLleu_22777 [Holothuria leucospilota]|uniref:Uncharacterized protein n=1 Tax=Holothuria leucospilota TaxID=206669 RepID=A0A9Q1H467_HOLLE|nr:hypothetical protein HOLleu_22777 [Holothuria leucospilota]
MSKQNILQLFEECSGNAILILFQNIFETLEVNMRKMLTLTLLQHESIMFLKHFALMLRKRETIMLKTY